MCYEMYPYVPIVLRISSNCQDSAPERAKLDLLFEQNLSGQIEGLGIVRFPGKKYAMQNCMSMTERVEEFHVSILSACHSRSHRQRGLPGAVRVRGEDLCARMGRGRLGPAPSIASLL